MVIHFLDVASLKKNEPKSYDQIKKEPDLEDLSPPQKNSENFDKILVFTRLKNLEKM